MHQKFCEAGETLKSEHSAQMLMGALSPLWYEMTGRDLGPSSECVDGEAYRARETDCLTCTSLTFIQRPGPHGGLSGRET